MTRFALIVVAVFIFFGVVRVLRAFLAGGSAPRKGAASGPPAADMIRDPVCGTWIDRRLAVVGRKGGQAVPVCSDGCRQRLEAG